MLSTNVTLRGTSRHLAGMSRGAVAHPLRFSLSLSCDGATSTLTARMVSSGVMQNPNPALRGKEGPIRPTDTSVSSPTGAWVTQPILVSDGAANLALYVEGESCTTILRVTIPASGGISLTVDDPPNGVSWGRFDSLYNLGNNYAPLSWDSEGVYVSQCTMTFTNLD